MRTLRIAVAIVLVANAGAPVISAQNLRGFIAGGVTADETHQQFPSAAGGVVVDVGQPWLSVGAEGETFWQWPYFAGRGTVFAQGNVRPRGPVQAVRPWRLWIR